LKVKVLFFGVLAYKAENSSVVVENVNDLDELKRNLKAKFSFLENTSYLIAVNQTVVKGNIKLNDNDEIALLPPYAGG
jgi:molybdopterin synthase sulfur carrier subunit